MIPNNAITNEKNTIPKIVGSSGFIKNIETSRALAIKKIKIAKTLFNISLFYHVPKFEVSRVFLLHKYIHMYKTA